MGMYIIGKEPDRCGVCPCFHAENPMYCQAVKASVQKPRIVHPYAKGRPEWCSIIEVPKHGRLIDADALKEAFCGNCFADEKPMECSEPCMDMRIILEAPTIIPAEEG